MATINPYLGSTKRANYYMDKANEYNKKHMFRVSLNFNSETEKSLVRWLENNRPLQTSIKRLIKEEIKRERLEKHRVANKAYYNRKKEKE